MWEKIIEKLAKDKNYQKVRDHCHYTGKYRGTAHSICNLRFNVPNKIPVSFHSCSNYDYDFVVKELAKEFEGQFECLGKNTEKISIPIEKEIKNIDKDGNESIVTISYQMHFIDSARFMAKSVSNLVDNLTNRIHKIKCKDCDCFLEYQSVNNNLVNHKCLSCN